MRTFFPWTSAPQVERVRKHWERQCEPKDLSRFLQILVDAFRQRMPRFVILDMPMVLVVSSVAYSPPKTESYIA
uniref:Uncharacterized protein n=1 Tax=Noccaea caerulescens TaxID=107243 RepID=A0A1J3HP71_NOCCA